VVAARSDPNAAGTNKSVETGAPDGVVGTGEPKPAGQTHSAAAGANSSAGHQQQTSSEPQQREENESKGPCGLPFKCSVS